MRKTVWTVHLLAASAVPLTVQPVVAQSNAELSRIYDEDQKDRDDPAGKIVWATVMQRDAVRRQRVAELLDSGALKTGLDFEHAAFIFQHGAKPTDFLVAHILGITASTVEPLRGIGIAAMALDRYLASIQQTPIFGLELSPGAVYDKALLPDYVRSANCVPSHADRQRMIDAVAQQKRDTRL